MAPVYEETSKNGEEEIFGIKRHLDFSRFSSGLNANTFLFDTQTSNKSEAQNLVTDCREAPSLPDDASTGFQKEDILLRGHQQVELIKDFEEFEELRR